MNMWLASGRAPLRAPALVCRPRTVGAPLRAPALVCRPRTLLHMHMSEAMHVRLCIPIRSLVAWAGEERYDRGRFPVRA